MPVSVSAQKKSFDGTYDLSQEKRQRTDRKKPLSF
jgi:hypothetical protein